MAQLLEPHADPLAGRAIAQGRYQLLSFREADELGRVYLGKHLLLERPVTIRVLHGSHLSDPQLVARFERAGLAASRIRHPNVVDVVDLGRDERDGSMYLVSEHLDGRSLGATVEQEGALEAYRVRDIGLQIAAALHAAHSAGVIHRDLKPENIVLIDREADDGGIAEIVKVLDFGVAKIQEPVIGGAIRHGTIEMISGRPEYMSPEQCNGLSLDARSDLYTCGCLLYYLATGRPPFVGGGLLDILVKQVREQPEPPSKHNPGVPAGLEAIILKLLAKKPDDRYATARDLRSALSRLQVHAPQRSEDGMSLELDVDEGGDAEPVTPPAGRPRLSGSVLPAAPVPSGAASPIRSTPPPPTERAKTTVVIDRDGVDLLPAARRERSSASTVMAAAIAIAIAVGVAAGLFFGHVYGPPATPSDDGATSPPPPPEGVDAP